MSAYSVSEAFSTTALSSQAAPTLQQMLRGLSLSLFSLLYINDSNKVLMVVGLILFPDDTNLFMSHKDPVYLAASLNSELNYPLGLRLTNSP